RPRRTPTGTDPSSRTATDRLPRAAGSVLGSRLAFAPGAVFSCSHVDSPEPRMPVIETQVDQRSAEFQSNATHLRALADDLRTQMATAALGGGDKARAKHTERGKLLPRERVRALLDPGSPFLEFSPLAAHAMYEGQAPCAGLIAGIGRVRGREVVVVA